MGQKATILDIVRSSAGVVLAFLWVGQIPLYSAPFGGCESAEFLSFEPGCSLWPEFLLGFGFVGLIALFAPKRFHLHVAALALVALVSLLGGPEWFFQGDFPSVGTLKELVVIAWYGSSPFFGGLLAMTLFLLVDKMSSGKPKGVVPN